MYFLIIFLPATAGLSLWTDELTIIRHEAEVTKEVLMKNLFKLLGIIAVIAVIGFTMASCATNSSIGGAAGPHGFFTGNSAANAATSGATVLGSYTVILGLFDSGFEQYAVSVKAAQEAGKQVYSVTQWIYIGYKTTAYAK